jgi:hypothetical protein
MLGPLTSNGRPTQTHALLTGSPAVNSDSTDCPPPGTDQRGVLRPQGTRCDRGRSNAAQPSGAWNCALSDDDRPEVPTHLHHALV